MTPKSNARQVDLTEMREVPLIRCHSCKQEVLFDHTVLAPHYQINHAGRPSAVLCQLCQKAYWHGYVGQGWRLGIFHGKNSPEILEK